MRDSRFMLVAVCSFAILSNSPECRGTPILRWNGGGASQGNAIPTGNPNEWDIAFTSGISSEHLSVYPPVSGVGVEKIRNVVIVSPNAGQVIVTLGRTETSEIRRFASVQNVEVDPNNDASFTVLGAINTTGNVTGHIKVHAIFMEGANSIGGNLTGNVDLIAFPNTRSYVQLKVDGSILGDVVVPDSGTLKGYILFLESTTGTIGTAADRVNIACGWYIESILAGEIHADITNPTDGYIDFVKRIEAVKGGNNSGVFDGTLLTGQILDEAQANYIRIGGDLTATSKILIGGSLAGSGNEISVQPSGLKGQVVINAFDNASTWQEPVKIGTTVLDPPATPVDYTNTAASLGGGAVGQAPYLLHATDSFPTRGQNITPLSAAPGPSSPIRIRHFGPLLLSGNPFKLERRAMGSGGSWQDQSACLNTPALDTNKNIVILTPTTVLQGGFEYRVSLNQGGSNTLKCDLVTGTPAVPAYSPEYTFTICELCPGDSDNNGTVNYDDVLSALANWGSTACLKAGDGERDGDVDFNDILTTYANWGETCCQASLMGGGGGEQEDPGVLLSEALNAMGFESLEDFIKHIWSLDESERNEMIQALGALLQGGK